MRLLLWSSSNTWRGWQGLGQICKPTPVGCTGLKSVTPPMFWQQELIQIFSPLCRKCRVASTIASAAQPTLAGSSSPGSAYGIAGVSCCPQMWLPTRLGTTTIGTRIAWTCCWWLPARTSRWHPTWFPRSSTRCSSDAQRVTLGSWAWGKSLTSGAHGSGVWAAGSSFQCSSSRVSSLGLPGRDPGQPGDEKEHAHIERSVVGWRGKAQAHCNSAQPALIAEILQGAFAGRAAWECVVPALLGGSHADFVEDVRRCCSKVDIMTGEDPLKSPQHLFALRTLAILLGCSAMASDGKGYYAAQAAASSSSGGDPAPGWRAADSLLMIAAQRARQWRESEGLLEDNDFAYAYTDYDRVGRSSCRR